MLNFKQLFKPKWQSPKAEVRIRAIEKLELSDPEQHAILCTIALADQNVEVRRSAAIRLDSASTLQKLLQQEPDPETRHIATSRLCALVCDSSAQCSLEQQLASLELLNDTALLTHIVLRARETDVQQAALQRLDDPLSFETIAIEGGTAQLRLQAAGQLRDKAALERVCSKVRNSDKGVYRICKETLKQIQQASKAARAEQAELESLLERINTHAMAENFPQYVAKYELLDQEWRSLEAQATDSLRAQAQVLLEKCRRRADEISRAQQAEQAAAHEAAERARALEAISARTEELINQIHQQLPQLALDQDALAAQLAELLEQGTALSASQPLLVRINQARALLELQNCVLEAAPEITRLSEQAPAQGRDALRKQLRALKKQLAALDWPESIEPPALLCQLHAQYTRLESALAEIKASQSASEDTLEACLNNLEEHLDAGESKAAETAHKDTCHALEQLSQANPALEQRFKTLHARFQELQGWQGYAATEKKEDLCSRMETLANNTEIAPDHKAKMIRSLQQEWRELDSTDPLHSQALWRRFKAASDKAYAPCEAWNKSQSQKRRFNLEQRQQICAQLSQYLESIDWNNPDWKAIEHISHAAKQEWRQYSPVDRAPGRSLQAEFNQLLERLDSPLKAFREQVRTVKEELISQARNLAQAEDAASAAEEAKALQQRWKEAGHTFHSVERKLWKQFREQCDIIFNRLKDQRKNEQTRNRSDQQHAERLLSGLHKILSGPHPHSQLQQTWLETEQAIQTLDFNTLPAKLSRSLESALNELGQQLETLDTLHNSPEYQALQRRILLCQRLETALLDNSADEALLARFKEEWQKGEPAPQEFTELVNNYKEQLCTLVRAPDTIELALMQTENKLRQLCVELEIRLDVPTPAPDQPLRTQRQLERLQAGVQQTEDVTRLADIRLLEYQCHCIPLRSLCPALLTRFDQLLQTAG